jgi:hypothetical protein
MIENVTQYRDKDFTVTWNADVQNVLNYSENDFEDVDSTDVILCDL